MATYREIHGKAIKTVTTNPSDDAAEGQIWFNSTDTTFKSIVALEAWSSASPLLQKRVDASGFGTQTANVCATGNIPPRTNVTEEYNGTGWSAGGNASQSGQYRAGFGTLTAGAVAGARTPAPAASNATEHYNGTSWTSGGNLPASIYLPGNQGAGTLTAGLVFGGDTGPGSSFPTASYEYDGSSWGSGGTTNTARSYGAGSGTQTAAFFACGTTPPFSVDNASVAFEQYNGSSWTSGPNLNTARLSTAAGGDTTAGLVFGGEIAGPAKTDKLETWDGTSWTLSPATLGTARLGTGRALGTGSNTANIASGGYTTTPVATTEEYNKLTTVITAGAWASGGNHPQDVRGGGSAGTQNAAWYVGGLQYPSDTKNRTDEYNGSSWTNVNNLPTNTFGSNACGTSTAGLIYGSYQGYGAEEQTYEWDGTNWTAGGSLPDIGPAYGGPGGGGTQTAAVACGGYGDPPPGVSQVMEYNGSTWSSNPNSLPASNYDQAGDGTSTALWLAGGYLVNTTTLHFDGTSFSTSGSLNSAREHACGAGYGTQTSAIVAGGSPSSTTDTQGEQYNGTSWVTAPSLSQGRKYGLGASRSAGSQTGFICGGATPPNPNTNKTEEFTPETTAINVKTLTQS